MAAPPEARTFEDALAVRERVPLLIGLVGPSGSGKTFSMLRLLAGIQAEVGGEIGVIDTEARRALWYADKFKFHHLDFKAPFGSLDYLAAIEHFYKKGVRNIGVDSWSHEHEGPGGVLEMHNVEVERLVKAWKTSADKAQLPAWAKPKAERRRLLNCLTQLSQINMLGCFRAKEKLKIVTGQQPIQLGWQPIAGEEFIYEMTMNLLLPPASSGIPDLNPTEVGEKALLKIPEQFRTLIAPYQGKPLDEALGSSLARWAAGGVASQPAADRGPAGRAASKAGTGDTKAQLDEIGALLTKHHGTDKAARGQSLLSAFGTDDRVAVAKMDPEALAAGLDTLRRNLENLAEMANDRQPGED